VGGEDQDIGVGARCDGSLAREQAEDLRWGSGRQLDPAVQRDASLPHAAIEDQAHARLNPRRTVRYLRKVVLAENLLFLHAERTVIRRDRLQIVEGEAAPQAVLGLAWPKRRAHDVLRTLEARLFVVVVRQE